jgi:hypothetical protein
MPLLRASAMKGGRGSFPQIRKHAQAHAIDAQYNHPQNASRPGKTLEPAARKADKNKLNSTLAPGNSMGEYKAKRDAI